MPELHPGPDASFGQLEAQLRKLGLEFNAGYFYTNVGGHWVLAVSDENYERWQATQNVGDPADEAGSAPAPDADPAPDGAESSTQDETNSAPDGNSGAQQRRTGSKSKGR